MSEHHDDLESAQHYGPSDIATSTLAESSGRLPASFLRGCGLLDWEIAAVKLHKPGLREDERTDILYEIASLQRGHPILYHSVFISYSTADEAFARRLHDDLQAGGVRCWFAPHDMKSGQKVHEQIERAISMQDRLLLVFSRSSMSSAWVKTEIANARQKERDQRRAVLFPVRLTSFKELRKWRLFDADHGEDSAREVREYFIPDFSDWATPESYRIAFAKVLADLRTENGSTPTVDDR